MSALGPDLRISMWPVASRGEVTWEWLTVIGRDSATGERPTMLEALQEATEAMRRIAAEKVQPSVTLGPGVPGVDVCNVEGCGADPDPYGDGGCIEHEEEARTHE